MCAASLLVHLIVAGSQAGEEPESAIKLATGLLGRTAGYAANRAGIEVAAMLCEATSEASPPPSLCGASAVLAPMLLQLLSLPERETRRSCSDAVSRVNRGIKHALNTY